MLLSAIVMISLDFVYLSVMKGYFMNQVKNVQGSALKLNYFGAAICYIFLVAGLNYFIIKPRKSVSDAFLLGLVIYGVYETTNYALFSNWSISKYAELPLLIYQLYTQFHILKPFIIGYE